MSRQTISFAPFKSDALSGAWRVRFGSWKIVDGRLWHVRDDATGKEAQSVIAQPGAEALFSLGEIEHLFPEGGFERVRIQLDMSLETEGNVEFALDGWGVEWRDVDAMRGNLEDTVSGSRGWFYDDRPLPDPTGTNRVDIIGDAREVRFLLNGREMFKARRHFEEPYRTIIFTSLCGLSVSNVVIEGDGCRPRRQPARGAAKPLLAATVDFTDDILEAPYTADMLKILVTRLAELGMKRVYWLHTWRVRSEALGLDADPQLSRALESGLTHSDDAHSQFLLRTARNCHPFLPKVCCREANWGGASSP